MTESIVTVVVAASIGVRVTKVGEDLFGMRRFIDFSGDIECYFFIR